MPRTKNPLDYANLNLDDPREHDAFLDAWIAKGSAQTADHLRSLKARGIIDEHGRRTATHTPADMLDPNSSVEQ